MSMLACCLAVGSLLLSDSCIIWGGVYELLLIDLIVFHSFLQEVVLWSSVFT